MFNLFANRPRGKVELITDDDTVIDITYLQRMSEPFYKIAHAVIKYTIIAIPCCFIAKPIADYLLTL